MSELENKVEEIVRTLFLRGDARAPLDREMDLLRRGVCDSLGLVELVAELEHAYPGLRIPDQEITPENLGSIRRIATFVQKSVPA